MSLTTHPLIEALNQILFEDSSLENPKFKVDIDSKSVKETLEKLNQVACSLTEQNTKLAERINQRSDKLMATYDIKIN